MTRKIGKNKMNDLLDIIRTMHEKYHLTCDDIEFTEEEKSKRIGFMQDQLCKYAKTDDSYEKLYRLINLVGTGLETVDRQGFNKLFERAFLRASKEENDIIFDNTDLTDEEINVTLIQGQINAYMVTKSKSGEFSTLVRLILMIFRAISDEGFEDKVNNAFFYIITEKEKELVRKMKNN